MKKSIGLFLLAVIVFLPGIALAAGPLGVYVAPKFVYGLTTMSNVKVKGYDFTNSDAWVNKVGDKSDSAFGGSLALGFDFAPQFTVPVRTELEYAVFSRVEAQGRHRYSPQAYADNKQTYEIQTLFLNAYWDIDTGTPFTPYVGVGAGIGFIGTKWKGGYADNAKNYTNSGSSSRRTVSNFAWNVGVGVGYDITENWTVDLGYRFVGLGSVKTASSTFTDMDGNLIKEHAKTSELNQHQFALGFRYTF